MNPIKTTESDVLRKLSGGAPSPAFVVMSMFARAHVWAAAIAGGVITALAMFLATAVLIVKGAAPGYEVGPNLLALQLFWPGYSMTWGGAVIGAIYAGVTGAVLGFITALFWNFAHIVVVGAAMLSGDWFEKG